MYAVAAVSLLAVEEGLKGRTTCHNPSSSVTRGFFHMLIYVTCLSEKLGFQKKKK